MSKYPRVASLKTADDLAAHAETLGVDLPIDRDFVGGDGCALARPLTIGDHDLDNRFCILPMEGWDGTTDGRPSDLTHRRWRNFGISGAAWIWGGEAVAVRHDGRANPNQLTMTDANASSIEALKDDMLDARRERFGEGGFFIGLQLTHSGRWARPNEKTKPEPRIVFRNPPLDRRLGITDDTAILSDDDLKRLVDEFVRSAVLAHRMGFHFIDVKHCHGYLGHEILCGVDRPGRYGGSIANRVRFLEEIVQGVASECPDLMVGTRLSLFDFVPFGPGDDNVGRPEPDADPRLSFGCDATGLNVDLSPTDELLTHLERIGVRLIATSAGVPYSTPHIQRPATFPPSDGYLPPEDPLVGVARQIDAVARMKRAHPDMVFVGSGYTYLQDHLAAVGEAVIAGGMADSIGLGRMVLSYPDLPADVIAGHATARKKICRTFSDCTTAPRNGIISGCYPLDPFYKERPEREQLKAVKATASTV